MRARAASAAQMPSPATVVFERRFDVDFCSRLTPMHVCAHFGHLHACRVLIEARADAEARDIKYELLLLNLTQFYGYALDSEWTPLHYAANFNHLDIVRLLLSSRADIEAVGTECVFPLTVFLVALTFTLLALSSGRTALHHSSFFGHTAVVQLLLSNNASVSAADRCATARLVDDSICGFCKIAVVDATASAISRLF